MKKILILFLLFIGIGFSQSVYKTITYQLDYAASDSIRFDKGYTLAGLLWPTSIGDTVYVDVSKGDGSWYRLQDFYGADLILLTSSSKASALALEPRNIYPFVWWRFVITDSDTSGNLPFTAEAVGVPYLSKEK